VNSVAAISDRRKNAKERRSESAATAKMRQSETAATVGCVRERLKRLDLVYQHFPIYFVTACTASRQQLLATEPVHHTFKKFVSSAPVYGAWVGAYVFMPDHFDLFVAIDDHKLSLSGWVKSFAKTRQRR
jgi:hypothetical protein